MVKATIGPCSGMIMTDDQYEIYSNHIADLNYIKSLNTDNSPIVIDSYKNWMYMYSESPIGTYTTWYKDTLYTEQLSAYYEENPHKIPKYIFIDSYDYFNNYDAVLLEYKLNYASEMFDFTQQELSSGILLTVENLK